MFSRDSASTTRLINRLVVACENDQVTLRAAAAEVPTTGAKRRLLEQAEERRSFQRELAELGAATQLRAAVGPHLRVILRRLRGALIGEHAGDAYRACEKAEVRSEAAYADVLRQPLPPEVRRAVERQHDEIAREQQELRLLRWGAPEARPEARGAPLDVAARREATARAAARARWKEAQRAEALARWSDDGGPQPEPSDER